MQARLDLIQNARALTTDEAVVHFAVRRRHAGGFDEAIGGERKTSPASAC